MDLSADKYWVAIQVRYQCELMVGSLLRRKGYEEFVPAYRTTRRRTDRIKEITLPLFPGYVFCRFNAEANGPIVCTPGVVRIVSAGKQIARIEDSEIEAIQTIMRSGLRAEPCAYLNIGDRVRIREGTLAGVEGILTSVTNRQQVIVSVSLIHGSISVEVDPSALVRIEHSAGARETDRSWRAQRQPVGTDGSLVAC